MCNLVLITGREIYIEARRAACRTYKKNQNYIVIWEKEYKCTHIDALSVLQTILENL